MKKGNIKKVVCENTETNEITIWTFDKPRTENYVIKKFRELMEYDPYATYWRVKEVEIV